MFNLDQEYLFRVIAKLCEESRKFFSLREDVRNFATDFAACNWGSADQEASDGGTFTCTTATRNNNNNNNMSPVTCHFSPVHLSNQQ